MTAGAGFLRGILCNYGLFLTALGFTAVGVAFVEPTEFAGYGLPENAFAPVVAGFCGLSHTLGNHAAQRFHIGGVHAGSGGAHRHDTVVTSGFHRLGIEVPEDFHMVRDESQRNHNDAVYVTSDFVDGVVNIGL